MRFEFKIRTADGEFWTQLQGSGGQIGNGCLHIDIPGLPEQECAKMLRALLVRARHELETEGHLRVWKGDHLPPAERIVPTEVLKVLEVRYVGAA